MEKHVEIFKALSDETRLRIINLLILSKDSICECELVDALNIPQYNISRHAKILKNAELILESKKGRWKYFSITKLKNNFIINILNATSSISTQKLKADYTSLIKRLKMRENKECVIWKQNLKQLKSKK